MTLTAIFGVMHLELVVGGEPGEFSWVVYILFAAFIAGGLLAVYFKSAKPEVYKKLGRAERIFEFLANRNAHGDR
jgi:hypothetical protein